MEIISQQLILPTCGFMKVSPITPKHFILIITLAKRRGKNIFMAIDAPFKMINLFKVSIMSITKDPETCTTKEVSYTT
ncbi:hypothetical protein D3C71_1852360 [compost metagenome]